MKKKKTEKVQPVQRTDGETERRKNMQFNFFLKKKQYNIFRKNAGFEKISGLWEKFWSLEKLGFLEKFGFLETFRICGFFLEKFQILIFFVFVENV